MGALSPEHLRVFLTVVERGSFSAAGRALRRSQTGISYAIMNLEEQFGVQLFERIGRRAALTAAGAALVPEAQSILQGFQNIRTRAAAIARGIEPELSIAVDAYFPPVVIADLAREFAVQFPQVQLNIHQEMIGNAMSLITDGTCALGIISHTMSLRPEFQSIPIPHNLRMVVVAAADHPLALTRRALHSEDLAPHIQLLSILKLDQDYGALSHRQWRCSDLRTQQALLLAGVGWAGVPAHLVQENLAAGRLVPLQIAAWSESDRTTLAMSIARLTNYFPGPAAQWVIGHLATKPIV